LKSVRKTAKFLKVSHMTISRWILKPQRKKYFRTIASKTNMIYETIQTLTQRNPLNSLENLQIKIHENFNISVSKDLIRAVRKKLVLSRKKVKFFARPKHVFAKTEEFLAKRDEYVEKGYNFISVDETSFGRNTAAVYGYSPKGCPIYMKKNNLPMVTKSALCAIDQNHIIARSVIKGAYTAATFLEFLLNLTLPINTVILLDNCRIHHSKFVKDFAQTQSWNLLYVPPYSPWFNPIEGVFSVVKRHFYKHGRIPASFESVTNQHVTNFFTKSFEVRGIEFIENDD